MDVDVKGEMEHSKVVLVDAEIAEQMHCTFVTVLCTCN
jgi:acid stress-induced BolA-like protein IbaG/YrbA